jgi:PAS domain S-box-containing protein
MAVNSAMEEYNILYVEDDVTEYEMVKALLESSGVGGLLKIVVDKNEFLCELRKNKYDIILTDFSLQYFTGIEVLQIIQKENIDIPVIFITANQPDEIAVEVIKKGAADYLLLSSIYRLLPSLRTAIERKRMQDDKNIALARLRESEENYRILAETSPYGIIVHSDFKLKYYNKKALTIFNADINADYRGTDILKFIHPHYHSVIKSRTKKLYKGAIYPDFLEIKLLNIHGEIIQAEIASAGITYGDESSAQVILRDISERKRMEEELINAKNKAEESDRMKTSFLENMSHEIRTPLNGIIGFSTLLKYKKPDNPERLKYLEIIEQSGKHLLNIINDLIEISRIESGHIEIRNEMVDLHTILVDLHDFFSKSAVIKNIDVSVSLFTDQRYSEAFVNTDFIRLKQVLINLLNNALKFTKKGRVDFGYEVIDDVQIKFFVKDTGIGIPEDSRQLVFERFRQVDDTKTKEHGGAGLGLTISKGLVEMMGGIIWFDSKPGVGTTFYFTLPLSITTVNTSFQPNQNNELLFENEWTDKIILIAEDEYSNYLLLSYLIKHTGAKIIHAKNGIEVLKLLSRKNDSYDTLIMDIKMPEMDGIQTIKEIRLKKYALPVIALTAYAMTDDRQKCINAGFDEYLTKPVKSTELLYKINSMFKKGSYLRSK